MPFLDLIQEECGTLKAVDRSSITRKDIEILDNLCYMVDSTGYYPFYCGSGQNSTIITGSYMVETINQNEPMWGDISCRGFENGREKLGGDKQEKELAKKWKPVWKNS